MIFLERLDIPIKRPEQSILSKGLRDMFGGGILTHAIYVDALKRPERKIVFDGMRWFGDLEEYRKTPNSCVLVVTAPIELRHQRSLRRSKPGEGSLTLDEFIEMDNGLAETEIAAISEYADFTIVNDTDLIDDYREKIREFWQFLETRNHAEA